MRALAHVVAAALAIAAGPAGAAPAVTLNGVPIDGMTGRRFEGATVVIDDAGGVHIEAPGRLAETGTAPPGPGGRAEEPRAALEQPGPGGLSHRYFLVTEHAPPGTQFDLAVFVNERWIREVRATEPHVVMEITRFLRPGTNKVVLAATKRVQEERASTSPQVTLSVVVGEGSSGGDRVTIDRPLVEARRTAAETQDRIEEYSLEAR